MKKFIAFALSCALILMSGCNQNTSEDETSTVTPSSEISSSDSVKAPSDTPSQESVKIDTKLSVPINIVLENDNSDAYETGRNEFAAGTVEDIKAYADWIYNLGGADIKALYGEVMPVFEYKQNTMSIADSQLVFYKLIAVTKDLYELPEFENPYTGGGWQLAIHTDEGISTVLFNGGWLVVDIVGMNKGFKFNLDGTDGQKLCTEINNILSDNMQSPPQ